MCIAGWAAAIKYNNRIKEEFEKFYQRQDTFSFGVCNGCQLMALLGWVSPDKDGSDQGKHIYRENFVGSLQNKKYCKCAMRLGCLFTGQGAYLDHNQSERYESRFVTVSVKPSNAVMLQGMEGSVFGVWVSHAEGILSQSCHI